MAKKFNITKKQSNELYELIRFTHDVLTKHKIDYWVTDGTLLGAVRHSGLIPWDDDGDICVMADQIPRLKKIRAYCDKKGYELDQMEDEQNDSIPCCGKGKNETDECDWYIGNKKHQLGCDIFVMITDPKKPSRVTFSNKYWRNAPSGGKKCYYERAHLFPLVPVHFGNFFVYGPNNPVERLNHCYGNDWNSHAQMLYNHRTGKWHKGSLRLMKSDDFKTIAAPPKTKNLNPPSIKKLKR